MRGLQCSPALTQLLLGLHQKDIPGVGQKCRGTRAPQPADPELHFHLVPGSRAAELRCSRARMPLGRGQGATSFSEEKLRPEAGARVPGEVGALPRARWHLLLWGAECWGALGRTLGGTGLASFLIAWGLPGLKGAGKPPSPAHCRDSSLFLRVTQAWPWRPH